ncbi:probable serine/threonine-protein kinase At1g01540 [Phoenix dactylifera]|uniref:non-specific serine/threonine protein kinase n=1 Tax=Phoenix dactylifera TaxID=42345 RepID=A0A8B9AQK5_PHODC|nr:probable serine/threonine-protein kinase At1g01540 [Phoenix dactylifera]XP_038988712.1 probable serine/threonine-protein kinase At1g01540 [Phoenix dactylifera]XP_038988713.1 probable serine/threonine-protein kinase At1g01540 [Phoenix dactylifera]XP_038988714.1 probable serine/threonine-protein kinase At1g01540 [Phoenix dactylifera]XP_038988715.1 probable serine/threonine-protein kinase At1g01540 [Phoenix dactylifera]
MPTLLAAIVGGLIGAIASLVIVVWFLWFCILHRRFPSNRNSETGSSDPPTIVEWSRRGRISFAGGGHATEHQGARQFTLEELSQATKSFDECNLVGSGSFGLVYKGLLLDGTIVAIKMRRGSPQPEFVEEVKKLSEICHRNLVTLIGYCQEGGLQMLVFEYLPNGSISHHLYDTGRDIAMRLEFKQRLSVAIGTAKGLNHLHSLVPQVVHKDFKSSNVLVDENFIAKVADAGIAKLLQRLDNAGPSRSSDGNVFQDPEVEEFGALSEASDVYSFGVFLLELITGREAAHLLSPESEESLVQWVEGHLVSNDLIDRRLGSSFTSEGMKDLIGLTLRCLNPSGRGRPKMSSVATELDRILETEMTLTTVMGDGTAIVTLGSQLFNSS